MLNTRRVCCAPECFGRGGGALPQTPQGKLTTLLAQFEEATARRGEKESGDEAKEEEGRGAREINFCLRK